MNLDGLPLNDCTCVFFLFASAYEQYNQMILISLKLFVLQVVGKVLILNIKIDGGAVGREYHFCTNVQFVSPE